MNSLKLISVCICGSFLILSALSGVSNAAGDDNTDLAFKIKEAGKANGFYDRIKVLRLIHDKRTESIKWWSGPEAKPAESKAQGEATWSNESRVLTETIRGKWGGISFQATIMLSFDSTLGKYTAIWTDTLSNRMTYFLGTPDESGKKVTFVADAADALSREPVKLRLVMQMPKRTGVMTIEVFRTDTGGTEYKCLEIVSSKRVQRAA